MQAPTFHNDDEEARYYVSVLRDGADADKIVARGRLAAVFERRGMFAEAVELYERNVQAGVQTAELLARLSEAYRQIGDADSADAALIEARRLYAAQVASPAPQRVTQFPPPPRLDPAHDDSQGAASTPTALADERYVSTAPLPVHSSADVASREALGVGAARRRRSLRTDAAGVPSPDGTPDDAATAATTAPSAPGTTTARRTGLLGIIGIVLFMIVLPVALLAVFVVNPLALYFEGKAAGPTIDAHTDTPAQVKIVPGWQAAWYLQDGRSVTGLWSTTGLHLTVDEGNPGAGRTFSVTPALPQPWGETITVVERRGEGRSSQDTIIPASFAVPSDLPAGGPLRTHVTGPIVAPRLTDGGQFATMTDAIERPIDLVVVSVPELLLDRFINSVSLYVQEDRWLLVTIGALLCWCVLAGATAVIARVTSRDASRSA